MDKSIVNLSNHQLTPADAAILSKGLSFIPTPQISKTPILEAANAFSRRLKLHNYFNERQWLKNSYSKQSFTGKSEWSPPDSKIDPELLTCISKFTKEIEQLKIQPEKSNTTQQDHSSLTKFCNNSDLVIKKADKGSAIVIMNKDDYLYEGYRQLRNTIHYKQLEEPMLLDTAKLITEILKDLEQTSVISEKQFKYLKPTENPRPRRFYTLPKIHKPLEKWTIPGKIPTGRPIVSDCSSESEKVAEFINDFLKSKAVKHPSYIKDTYDFVEKIKELDIPKDALLITLDVESMYTNIDHDKGLEAVQNAFEEHEKTPKFFAIMKLLELSLKRNDFEFNNENFLQLTGTALGSPLCQYLYGQI